MQTLVLIWSRKLSTIRPRLYMDGSLPWDLFLWLCSFLPTPSVSTLCVPNGTYQLCFSVLTSIVYGCNKCAVVWSKNWWTFNDTILECTEDDRLVSEHIRVAPMDPDDVDVLSSLGIAVTSPGLHLCTSVKWVKRFFFCFLPWEYVLSTAKVGHSFSRLYTWRLKTSWRVEAGELVKNTSGFGMGTTAPASFQLIRGAWRKDTAEKWCRVQ